MVNHLSQLFAVPPPGVELDVPIFDKIPRMLAAYDVDRQMIYIRSDKRYPELVYHEFGHHYYHILNAGRPVNSSKNEAFAHWFEVVYQADNLLNFICQVCGSTGPIQMLDILDIQCLNCGSTYAIQFY